MLFHFVVAFLLSHLVSANTRHNETCRFSPTFSHDEVLANPEGFIKSVIRAEGKFHSNGVGYNSANGMTYDGTLLNYTTGLANSSGLHPFSAASKESLQMMMYAKILSGDPLAAYFLSDEGNVEEAKSQVMGVLRTKLEVYTRFNTTFPGFGGLLPWFYSNETDLRPTSDWVNRIPALDNGELIWAVYAVVGAMEDCNRDDWRDVQIGWQQWLDYSKTTAATLFYNGTGKVCDVVSLTQSLPINDPAQNVTCANNGTSLLDDPYEGELFTWWLYFFAPQLNATDKEALWQRKRAKLVAVDYNGSVVDTAPAIGALTNYSGLPVYHPLNKSVTVQEGFWFSAHEQWKLLEMPYLDNSLIHRVFANAERARTCDGYLTSIPGLFASVNNVTNLTTFDVNGYISPAGIPSISVNTAQELDIITPYGSFPTFLFNQSVALAWYKNMLDGPGMQNPYGSTESTKRDGSAVSALVTWDSKITTVVAMLGGVGDIVSEKMKRDGIYDEFQRVTQREYGMVFGDDGERLKGEDVELCYPNAQIPQGGKADFTACA